MGRHNAYRDGFVHVCEEMCSTCIFRPGNLMQLKSGRVREMIAKSLEDDSAIVCHKTLSGDNAVCRGFFDRHKTDTAPLRLALVLDCLRWQDPEPSST